VVPVAWTAKEAAVRDNHNYTVIARPGPEWASGLRNSRWTPYRNGLLKPSRKKTKVGSGTPLLLGVQLPFGCDVP
jgi:hypothetical protein